MEKRVIAIAQSYSEKNLMQVFQATDGGRLFEFGDGGDVEEATRPFIDKKIREMVRLMQANHLPVYMKKKRTRCETKFL